MLNREIYLRAPEQSRLLNHGVVEISEDRSEAAERVLRYELETFVCSGQYEAGLRKILETFLTNLGTRSEQPGVWISGFYGSGKSHLAKMLRTLWTDYQFSDGATARGLARLHSEISDLLKELSVQGKRLGGGLHAAAGKLGAGANANVRLALLGIVFRSAGLPEEYHLAQFVMWLKRENLLDAVAAELRAMGRTLESELPDLYVSDYLAEAVRKAKPGFADSNQAARLFFEAQFPQVTDVTNNQMVEAIHRALAVGGKFPLTLIVLDEVQQFIGSDGQKAYLVQEVTETLSKKFSGLLLFVGTGQSALSGTPNLQRLLGRFPVSVMLGDWDVENVTREIILAKKPSAKPAVEAVWRRNLGEISRHLRGTKLEHVTADEEVLTADYPILPVRRRFWERVLRSIDTTGTASQLRSQLRVVHEAVLATADLPLGHVVAGDFLYDQIAATLVSTAQLPKEIFENIQRLAAGDETSQLKARILKLIYLINKLPSDVATDIGLHATEDVLADLLITDLEAGSSALRKALPPVLDELQNKDRLIIALEGPAGIEYRLQTRESSAWYEEFRAQENEYRAAPQRIEVKRAELIRSRFTEILSKVRVVQGNSHEARTLTPWFDDSPPKDSAKALYLWIQDGWQTDEKSVVAEARAMGAENPTVLVFLPAQNRTDIANAIVAREAAQATLQRRGNPSTEEGRDAQRAMETRLRNAERELSNLVDRLFEGARVFLAGGQEVTDGANLAERITRAARTAAIRLYREFDLADHDKWDKVLEEARKGNQEALKFVGHQQEADKHPVCQKILTFIGPGKKGCEIRDHFTSPPYGWSRDAIDGALYALLASGHLRVTDASGSPLDAKTLDRNKLTQANFRRESITLTPQQKIRIRALFNELKVPCQLGEELTKAPQLIRKLREHASAAGGPAPAPAHPDTTLLEQLEAQSGNALLLELYNHADELTELARQWQKTHEAIQARMPSWSQLTRLLQHGAGLSEYASVKADADAIVEQRSLLDDPDPVRPLVERMAAALRRVLNEKLRTYAEAYEQANQELQADSEWRKLDEMQCAELVARYHLEPPKTPDLSSVDSLLAALDECSLEHWTDRINALPTRFDRARHAAAEMIRGKVRRVSLPKRTLTTEAELRQWLSEVEALLTEELRKGPITL